MQVATLAPNPGPALRYAVPDRVRNAAGSLARWLRRLAVPQLVIGGSAAVIACCLLVAGRMSVALGVAVVLGTAAAAHARLLLSAATELACLGGEPEVAHEHLRRAFTHVRGVVVIDLALATMLLVRNVVAAVAS